MKPATDICPQCKQEVPISLWIAHMQHHDGGWPKLPSGMSRQDCIDGLKELRDQAIATERRRDSTFVRWPDLDALLEYIDKNGFPPPESAIHNPQSAIGKEAA